MCGVFHSRLWKMVAAHSYFPIWLYYLSLVDHFITWKWLSVNFQVRTASTSLIWFHSFEVRRKTYSKTFECEIIALFFLFKDLDMANLLPSSFFRLIMRRLCLWSADTCGIHSNHHCHGLYAKTNGKTVLIRPVIQVEIVQNLYQALNTTSRKLRRYLLKKRRAKIQHFNIYYRKEVLREAENLNDGIGAPILNLSLFLLLAWVVIAAVLVRGIRSSGKASYFLALFPYVVIGILLIRAVTLEGAWNGIVYFLKPRWDKILEPGVSHIFCL